MTTAIQCSCGKWLDADEQARGDKAKCPACGNVFVVGEPVRGTTAIQTEPPALLQKPSREDAPSGDDRSVAIPIYRTWAVKVVVIGVVLAVVAGVVFSGMFFGVRTFKDSPADIGRNHARGVLTTACMAYSLKNNGAFPKDLAELRQRNDFGGPYLENDDALLDPWQNPYQYDAAGPMNNGVRPDIWTFAPDGAKIGNWPKR